jgi:hypothetical protein
MVGGAAARLGRASVASAVPARAERAPRREKKSRIFFNSTRNESIRPANNTIRPATNNATRKQYNSTRNESIRPANNTIRPATNQFDPQRIMRPAHIYHVKNVNVARQFRLPRHSMILRGNSCRAGSVKFLMHAINAIRNILDRRFNA